MPGNITGAFAVRPPVGRGWDFHYEVLRLWERSPRDFLDGPLGLLPFAPLAAVSRPDLSAVVELLRSKIDGQADRPLAAKLFTASYLLMGLKYDQPLIDNLFRRCFKWKSP